MQTSRLKPYRPFLVVLLVQALFIAVAPSLPSTDEVAAQGPLAGSFLPTDEEGVFVDPETGELVTAEGVPIGPGATASGATRPGAVTGGGQVPGAGAGAATAAATGDISHCKGDRQFDILHASPACTPKWPGGDNGGATYKGVTSEEVKIVFFGSVPNPAVDAVLAPQGLARSPIYRETAPIPESA